MAFDEVQFPVAISLGAEGGPQFSTIVITTDSGDEQRIAQWSQARRRWNVAHALKTPAQRDELIAFFVARQGRARGFRFKDWADYQVATATATAVLTTTTFQLQKIYPSGAVTHTRTIAKPVSGTVRLWHPSTGVEITTGWSVATATGIVTFGSPPGYTPNATCDFDVPVRFDTDALAWRQDDPNVGAWESIPIVEVRV